ncbi:MAG TPA: hypothetical protein VGP47_02610 [Parachlamydiaceae bacterium]|nr:hypothetical protein [Parachlamydiaceae bacterium]
MGMEINSSQAIRYSMEMIGGKITDSIKNAHDSIVTALPRGSLYCALGGLSIYRMMSNWGDFPNTPLNLQREFMDIGALSLGIFIAQYVENQKVFIGLKQQVQEVLIVHGKKIHPEWESKSDVEILEHIELKIPGRINSLTNDALAVPKYERDQVISKLAQQLISK